MNFILGTTHKKTMTSGGSPKASLSELRQSREPRVQAANVLLPFLLPNYPNIGWDEAGHHEREEVGKSFSKHKDFFGTATFTRADGRLPRFQEPVLKSWR